MTRAMSLFLGTLLLATSATRARQPLVFISAFASADRAAIHAFQFDPKRGTLKPLHRTTDLQNPFFLALSPDGRFLYAINAREFGGTENELVAAYAIEGRTGRLRRLNQQSSRGTASCYLDVAAAGRTVTVANYSSGSVAALRVQKDGSLGEAVSFVQHRGSSVDPERQQGPRAHSIVISPDSRFALAADLGIDQILSYRLDAAAARLTTHETQPFAKLPPGSGPRPLAFHPNGRRVYVINELKSTVTCFDYAADAGTLTERQTISTLPGDFTGRSLCADLKITPDGRWLLSANMPGNSVGVFRIDHRTGGLTAAGNPLAMPMPSCIRWLP